MNSIFYKGKLSPVLKPSAYLSCCLAWLASNVTNSDETRFITQKAYNSEFTDHVSRYDELATYHFEKVSNELLSGIDIKGKSVLDIGCGTGIASMVCLKAGASKVTCTDAAPFMLDKCRKNIEATAFGDKADFYECDAGALDFPDNHFDIVISSLLIGLVPHREEIISEMIRVLHSGGILAFSTHGIEHNWEIADMTFRVLSFAPSLWEWGKIFFKSPSFFPGEEKEYVKILSDKKLTDIRTRRKTWVDEFNSPDDAMDFLLTSGAAGSSYMLRTQERRDKYVKKLQAAFNKMDLKTVTHDVIYAYGVK